MTVRSVVTRITTITKETSEDDLEGDTSVVDEVEDVVEGATEVISILNQRGRTKKMDMGT